ncbi:hypothetical protein VHEMI08876 [[Torrubiella] hemipterigena]|uniref:Uncharacterized protein n=1 Tax=[Torrubiella] hemipterigena TaxID=1531966 RepID=A0A0A1TP09_9HYPO|nr:hypothetical protein VHEMI08876 [[Torrubiella] hemipterigena]
MKTSTLALLAGWLQLLPVCQGSEFSFGKTDFHNFRYKYTCTQLAGETTLSPVLRNQYFAICLIQRNSVAHLLLDNPMQNVLSDKAIQNSYQDQLSIVNVAHDEHDLPYLPSKNDGKTEVRVRDVLLMAAEMCSGNKNTRFISNIRDCGHHTKTSNFQGCVCAKNLSPAFVVAFQNCVLGYLPHRADRYTPAFVNETSLDNMPPYSCRAKIPARFKSSHSKRHDKGCYFIYEDGYFRGTTGCQFDGADYLSGDYSQYPVYDDGTVRSVLPSSVDMTVETATAIPTGIPSALRTYAPTDATVASTATKFSTYSSGSGSRVVGTIFLSLLVGMYLC